jgi:uncharacterized protein YbjT (DUF2867 family)
MEIEIMTDMQMATGDPRVATATKVLVTGGTGVLGAAVVSELARRGAIPRILSRRGAPGGAPTNIEWARGDLGRDDGLAEALAGAEIVIHCATTSSVGDPNDDVDAVRRLLPAAEKAGVRHLVFPSIVGIDAVGFFPYYRARLEIESLLERGGVPHTILRATQFHEFVAHMLEQLTKGPLLILPRGSLFQPVDVSAVAARMVDAALREPAGRIADVAGPEILRIEDLARTWLHARSARKLVLALPLPIPIARSLRAGHLTSGSADRIGIRWSEWLARHGAAPTTYATRGR